MAGSAMLAIAVSSEAMARAVKIAATAHRRRSRGKPSIAGMTLPFAAAVSCDIPQSSPPGDSASHHLAGCTMDRTPSTGAPLHDAYAAAPRSLRPVRPDPHQLLAEIGA